MEKLSAYRPFSLLLTLAFTATVLIGCSDSGIGVRPVTGFVGYQGKPLEGALVMFCPKGNGRVASGYTDASGNFQLSTSGATKSGAMEGEYDVLINKMVDVDASGNPISYDSGEYSPEGSAQQKRGKSVSQIPKRYNDAKSPVLTATVAWKGNDFRFELEEDK